MERYGDMEVWRYGAKSATGWYQYLDFKNVHGVASFSQVGGSHDCAEPRAGARDTGHMAEQSPISQTFLIHEPIGDRDSVFATAPTLASLSQ